MLALKLSTRNMYESWKNDNKPLSGGKVRQTVQTVIYANEI